MIKQSETNPKERKKGNPRAYKQVEQGHQE